MRRTRIVGLFTVAALPVCAWSSVSSRTSAQSDQDNACALLTTAQVSTALGTTVESGQPLVASNPKVCGWAPPGGPQIDGKKVTVALMTLKSYETGKTPMKGIEKSPLTGVGDDAIYITAGGLGTGLNVQKGNSAFQVRVGGFKKDQAKEIEKALALEILKKV
jgi:hypothetical protein